MMTSNQKTAMTLAFEHQLTPGVTLFGDVLYSKYKTYSQLAAQPITGLPAGAAFATPDGSAQADHPQNPFDGTVNVRNRFVDYPRGYDTTNDSFRFLAGLRGKINENWFWESALNYNEVNQRQDQTGVIDRDMMTGAIDSGLLNLFAVEQAPGAIERSGILGTAWQKGHSTLTSFDLRLNGAIENIMPAGPIQFAVGMEFRRETIKGDFDEGSYIVTDPDDPYYSAPVRWDGALGGTPFGDSRNVAAGFVQVRVPIASPTQKISGLHRLEIDGAVRYERYSDTDDPVVPKILIRYLPFNDQLAFRASYSESFNAPTLFALHTSGGVGFTSEIYNIERANGTVEDLGGDQALQSDISNVHLKPEKSKSYNIGIVYSPKAIKGLVLEANYFYIKRKDVIDGPTATEMLQDVELKGAASEYAQYIKYGGFAGTPFVAPGALMNAVDADSGLWNVFMTMKPENVGSGIQDGIDFSVRYDWGTSRFGSFGLQAGGMWYRRYDYGIQFDSTTYIGRDYVGTTSGLEGQGTLPRWVANASATWEYDNWTASVFGNYIPKVTARVPDFDDERIDNFMSFDIAVGYSFKKGILKGMTVRAGCNNVFDKMPPLAPTAWTDANADTGTYGCLGRVLYVDVSYKF